MKKRRTGKSASPEPKRKGGKPKGPPSERMSLNLEEEVASYIRKAADVMDVPISHVVRDLFKPLAVDGDYYLSFKELLEAIDPASELPDSRIFTEKQVEEIWQLIFWSLWQAKSFRNHPISYINPAYFEGIYLDSKKKISIVLAVMWKCSHDDATKIVDEIIDKTSKNRKELPDYFYIFLILATIKHLFYRWSSRLTQKLFRKTSRNQAG